MSKKQKAPKKVKEPPRPERTESGGLDYSVYYMKPAERLGYILLAAAGLFALGYIFYRSAILAGLLKMKESMIPTLAVNSQIKRKLKKIRIREILMMRSPLR